MASPSGSSSLVTTDRHTRLFAQIEGVVEFRTFLHLVYSLRTVKRRAPCER